MSTEPLVERSHAGVGNEDRGGGGSADEAVAVPVEDLERLPDLSSLKNEAQLYAKAKQISSCAKGWDKMF